MKLTDDLPLWVAVPLRLLLYAFVMFILYNIALALVLGQVRGNTQECVSLSNTRQDRLQFAKSMVGCLRNKNNFIGNLLLSPLYNPIDAMPNAPKEFVGTWIAVQPRCSYKHTLSEDGRFVSEPQGCSLSNSTFHGTWGVFKDKFIWLQDEATELPIWPPDINQIDSVDRDFFLLTEHDGTRTRFTRVDEPATSSAHSPSDSSSSIEPIEAEITVPDAADSTTGSNEAEVPPLPEAQAWSAENDTYTAPDISDEHTEFEKPMDLVKPEDVEEKKSPYDYPNK